MRAGPTALGIVINCAIPSPFLLRAPSRARTRRAGLTCGAPPAFDKRCDFPMGRERSRRADSRTVRVRRQVRCGRRRTQTEVCATTKTREKNRSEDRPLQLQEKRAGLKTRTTSAREKIPRRPGRGRRRRRGRGDTQRQDRRVSPDTLARPLRRRNDALRKRSDTG